VLVVEVGHANDDESEMYRVLYDGVVIDEQRYSVLGGSAETVSEALKAQYTDGLELAAAIQLGAKVLGTDEGSLGVEQLEVALLDRNRPRRAFRRIRNAELEGMLASK
jgi:proteasome alpha subunit